LPEAVAEAAPAAEVAVAAEAAPAAEVAVAAEAEPVSSEAVVVVAPASFVAEAEAKPEVAAA
jgi:hypothetical protein